MGYQNVLKSALVVLALSLGGQAQAVEVTVVQADGEELTGTLEGIDAAAGVSVRGKSVKQEDIAEMSFAEGSGVSAKDLPVLHLRNGDVLPAEVQGSAEKADALKINSKTLGELLVRYDSIRGIEFPAKGAKAEAVERFMAGGDPKEDQVLMADGSSATGAMESFSDKELKFNDKSFAYEKMAAFRLAPLEAFKPLTGLVARVKLADGAQLSGKLTGFAAGKIAFSNLAGETWQLPAAAVHGVSYQGGKLVYLADLEPKADEQPLVGGAPVVMHWRKNAAASGDRLRAGGKTYERGIGVHSYCKLSYALGGTYALFLGEVALDASAGGSALCAWKLLGDGKELAAGEAKAETPPAKLKVDVSGIQTLELICDYGPDKDDAGDHLDWLNARLLKK